MKLLALLFVLLLVPAAFLGSWLAEWADPTGRLDHTPPYIEAGGGSGTVTNVGTRGGGPQVQYNNGGGQCLKSNHVGQLEWGTCSSFPSRP